MDLTRCRRNAILVIVAALSAAQPGLAQTQCVPLHDGVEYRAFLPDKQRFIYVAVKVLTGIYPSVFVIADKNFEAPGVKLAPTDPLNQWWVDRARPMTFSIDKVKVHWEDHHTFDFVTNMFSSNPPRDIVQTFRGLSKTGDHFEGIGAADTNSFAFQTRIELSGFRADGFDVTVPAVSFDGVTVTPPVIHFERDDEAVSAKC